MPPRWASRAASRAAAISGSGPDPDSTGAAETVGKALENEQAIAYLAQANIHDGVDRVVAIFDDGRAFAWHQLNEKYKD